MSEPIPPRALAGLDVSLSPSDRLAVLHLAAADGPQTAAEVAHATGVSRSTASARLGELAGDGVLDRHLREHDTETGGRAPFAYELSARTRSGLAVEAPEWSRAALRRRVLVELALLHYDRQLSSATSNRVAREIEGASPRMVSSVFGDLSDGPVEDVADGSSRNRWRLVGAGLYVPFRATQTADAGAAFADGGEAEEEVSDE